METGLKELGTDKIAHLDIGSIEVNLNIIYLFERSRGFIQLYCIEANNLFTEVVFIG